MLIVGLAHLVALSVEQIALVLARQLGGPQLAGHIQQWMGQRNVDAAVDTATTRAWSRFEREEGQQDPELVAALGQSADFMKNERVAEILAGVATNPIFEESQVRGLADEMRAAAPQCSAERCARAARLLVNALHDEAANITELQQSLSLLRGRQLIDALERLGPTPPFARHLNVELRTRAQQISDELGQGHVTSAHMLYAVATLPEASSTAQRALLGLGISAERIKEALREVVHAYHGDAVGGAAFTVGASSALADARQVARRAGALQTQDIHVLQVLVERVIQGSPHSGSLTAVFERVGYPHARMHEVLDRVQRDTAIDSVMQSTMG